MLFLKTYLLEEESKPIKNFFSPIIPVLIIILMSQNGLAEENQAVEKKTITALYLPLADHYTGVLAYEKYAQKMQHAQFSIRQMKSSDLMRAAFEEGQADLAFIVSPMAMEMFDHRPNFRFISLLHRDGSALAINNLLNQQVQLADSRLERKPDEQVAHALANNTEQQKQKIEVAVPSLMSTHIVILHKYMRDHGKQISLGAPGSADAVAIEVAPSRSPLFLKKKDNRQQFAAFVQSLPWADVVETQGMGKVVWYSKDVMPWPYGHVECIVIATDRAIREKPQAIGEVIHYLHQAGLDIEETRSKGVGLDEISTMIRKHIPEHSHHAISESLRVDLMVINYQKLNVDKAGLRQIMDYALDAGVLHRAIDIDAFTDPRFSSKLMSQ